jgi:hypothetical protein
MSRTSPALVPLGMTTSICLPPCERWRQEREESAEGWRGGESRRREGSEISLRSHWLYTFQRGLVAHPGGSVVKSGLMAHCRTRTRAAYLRKSWRYHHLYTFVQFAFMHFVNIFVSVMEPVHLVVCGHLPLSEEIHEGECSRSSSKEGAKNQNVAATHGINGYCMPCMPCVLYGHRGLALGTKEIRGFLSREVCQVRGTRGRWAHRKRGDEARVTRPSCIPNGSS